MRRALDSAAQIVLCVLLAAVALIAATPLRLPPRAPESSVAPPGTRAMWLWRAEEPGPVVDWAAANGVRALVALAALVLTPGGRRVRQVPGRRHQPGADLTQAQVDEFRQRVVGDPGFADRLTRRIQATCGTARSAGVREPRDTRGRVSRGRLIYMDIESCLELGGARTRNRAPSSGAEARMRDGTWRGLGTHLRRCVTQATGRYTRDSSRSRSAAAARTSGVSIGSSRR